MNGREPLTKRGWQFVLAFLCALPAFFVGFWVGGYASHIGSHRDFGSVLARGGVCGLAPVVFALFSPRYWIIPAAIYGFGFLGGYTLGDAFAVGMSVFLAIPYTAITGERFKVPSEPSHPELLWIYVIALWLAALTSVLRLHFERKHVRKN